ncbi:alpha/beta-hydrolase [Trichodelitschia bisporula]|uniref:Alpha/beta-hydrolase n=1 Tax=Trichodelitschia bisporula TaxID=703511 RepID=A0A6G1I2Z2_9PEZI|nr:alpha/beta-hydrolase [Trichodelitschia bisporula]
MAGFISTVALWFRPARDALFAPSMPFAYRWRLLLLQPLVFLTYAIHCLPNIFNRAYSVRTIPTGSNRSVRALVFRPPSKGRRCPLHLDFHGGAFLGGLPEYGIAFLSRLAIETGAVVVSTQYRCAPVHPFPAAVDDAEFVLVWLQENAEKEFGADPSCITVSGFSAGGNLALAAALGKGVKAYVGFYAAIDLRIPPWEKPKPPGFPAKDPLAVLLPLMDAYGAGGRVAHAKSPRFSPIIAAVDDLPDDMLFVIPAVDVLQHEQLAFVKRVRSELEARGETGRRVEGVVFDGMIHGWMELPGVFPAEKKRALDLAVMFLKETQAKHGY